jgi:hypothetical protein
VGRRLRSAPQSLLAGDLSAGAPVIGNTMGASTHRHSSPPCRGFSFASRQKRPPVADGLPRALSPGQAQWTGPICQGRMKLSTQLSCFSRFQVKCAFEVTARRLSWSQAKFWASGLGGKLGALLLCNERSPAIDHRASRSSAFVKSDTTKYAMCHCKSA